MASFVEATHPAWGQVLSACDHDVYHLPGYVAAAAGPEGRAVAFLYEEPGGRLLQPLVLRPVPGTGLCDAASPYGYSGPVSDVPVADLAFWERASRALVAEAAAARLVSCFVRLHPLLPAPTEALAAVGRVVHHGSTVSLDLRLSEDEGWSRLRKDHRKDIARFVRSGGSVVFDAWHLLDEWVDAYHESMRRLGAADSYFFTREHFAQLRSELPEQTHLAVALDREDRLMAGSFFFEHRGLVSHYVVATRTERFAEHPSKAVYDAIRRWGTARGHRSQHLGGGVGAGEDGVFRFKAGFSDRRHPFSTWRVVPDPAAYRELAAAGGAGPEADDLSGWFPAYRRPSSQPVASATPGTSA
ncbi:GNAT family N-acetyltransferase [Cellulomonas aerilata]|nr:GNAT family N-acetyltransferase [Cellulomonas aerilata]